MEIDERILAISKKIKAQWQEMLMDCGGEDSQGWYGWINRHDVKELLEAINEAAKAPVTDQPTDIPVSEPIDDNLLTELLLNALKPLPECKLYTLTAEVQRKGESVFIHSLMMHDPERSLPMDEIVAARRSPTEQPLPPISETLIAETAEYLRSRRCAWLATGLDRGPQQDRETVEIVLEKFGPYLRTPQSDEMLKALGRMEAGDFEEMPDGEPQSAERAVPKGSNSTGLESATEQPDEYTWRFRNEDELLAHVLVLYREYGLCSDDRLTEDGIKLKRKVLREIDKMRHPERESIKGVYVCNHCNNTELVEREVACWRCGFGEMVYRKIDLLPLDEQGRRG